MVKKIFVRLITGICISIVIVALVLVVIGTIAIKKGTMMDFFGYSYSIVATPSMEPHIKTGSIIIGNKKPFESIEVDDIVIYRSDVYNRFIVHRVVRITEDGSLEIKGDNNSSIDSETVNQSNYQAVVVFKGFSLMGKLVLNSQSLMLGVIVLLFALYLVLEIKDLRKIIFQGRAEKEKEKTYQEARQNMRNELIKEIEEEKNSKN